MLKLSSVILLIFVSFIGSAQINMVVKAGGFLFMEGKDSIFFYQKSMKDKNGEYGRCHYIHPLYSPDGSRITEDFPADHLHHRGIFWAWHQIFIGDKQVSDGWELKNFQQKVTNFEFILLNGKGVINTTVEWKSPLWENGKKAYIKEDTRIIIHPLESNCRQIDFEIKLKALTDRLSIGGSADDKGYGGFSARLRLPEDVKFFSDKTCVEPQNSAIQAGNFMNITGTFLNEQKPGGVVIYSNPENPKPSNNWILRKSASMQNVAFPGSNPVAIPFEHPITLKYSILVYQGTVSPKLINKIFR